MREEWARCTARAERLAAENAAVSSLLTFYAGVLRWQAEVDDSLRNESRRPSGAIERDLAVISRMTAGLLRLVVETGPAPLASEATRLLDGPAAALEDTLLTWWHAPSDRQFFPKAILQPYAQLLAELHITTARRVTASAVRCPLCGGAPQLSILTAASGADGGGRQLLCAACLTAWPYRRVVCAHCSEEDEHKLSYFQSPTFEHLRVDACDTCGRYLKTVDLTRLGVAVPLVDEVAGATLDMWAREQGYTKIELNLLGL